jgi:hypothetical protein
MPSLRRAGLVLALVTAATAGGCGDDPFRVRPIFSTRRDSFWISLTSAPTTAQAYWRVFSSERYRRDSIGNQFDLAFSLNASGNVVVLPARLVILPPAAASSQPPFVGLQTSASPYENVAEAPADGWRVDTALVVSRGQTVLMRSQSSACVTQGTGTNMYAKFVVDTIDAAGARLFIRAVVQPSCGFRSFASGLPSF